MYLKFFLYVFFNNHICLTNLKNINFFFIQPKNDFNLQRPTMAVKLNGSVALVTGGGRGLGLAFTQVLVENGASVSIHNIFNSMANHTPRGN